MTSVFSSLVRPPKRTPSSSSSLNEKAPALASSDADEPDLSQLNACLQALTDMFPDIQPDVFREMLGSFSDESRLEVVTEALLKQGAKWVRGRYRMPPEQDEQRAVAHTYKYRQPESQTDTRGVPLALEQTFRSRAYKEAVKEALYHEFKGLSHATVKAVLAEYNWSYMQARPTLLVLASKSWRSSITNFFMRRKAPSVRDHPLVMWLPADPKTGRPRTPLAVKTKSRELDRELHEALIRPELERQRQKQVQKDFALASKCNEEEAEKEGEMYDCECCFMPHTLQQMSTCHAEGHYICFQCIRHSINAALYDQGWARNINTELCTLRCIAPTTDSVEDCPGCIPPSMVERALLEDKDGEDLVNKLHERFSSEALIKSQLPLVRCPFCSYAEVDDLALPQTNLLSGLTLKKRPFLLASIPVLELLCFQLARMALASAVLFLSCTLLLNCILPTPVPLFAPLQSILRRIHLKRRGLRLQCLAPSCRRTSCLSCHAPWHDPHTCYASQRTSLRLTLEAATTAAVKRTCPQCQLGFVKAEGCNKLVCLCGYAMCYVCREGLAREGYTHFCQHFRDRPGETCAVCEKCDLYRVEDEDVVVGKARERAEREWWERQGGVGRDMKAHVGKGLTGWGGGVAAGKTGGRFSGWMRWEHWLERLIEAVVE
ncbi:hypothetical protein BDV95DRAFT_625471 [Massariosphaeria phaeospora]|uniref:RING-type domain-containing protein n=1 Tax=Massariosphaeria phaeospora TaxID=100035 RepID=A0A7C8IEW7_9PLEO|nr:hypothetical protein BDV95DRAFT_625471 [Massariosphaeria phaeospora]